MAYSCDDCNFKTGYSNCWYFGQMTVVENVMKHLRGCEKHRCWWEATSVRRTA